MQFQVHLNRPKSLEHLSLIGEIEGKRDRGRPRVPYLENLYRWVTGKDQNNIVF